MMLKFFIFCHSFPFCERAVGLKETTIVPFSDYYFNTITLSVQESRGRRGIPPLEPLLPRRPRGILAQASACPLGQDAETKFSSALIEKRKWARKFKNVEENFVEA